jgi:Peptidase family M48
MTRYGIAAGLLALYVTGAVWVVGREGETYRLSLQHVPVVSPVEPNPPADTTKHEPPAPPPVVPIDTPKAVPAPPDTPKLVPALPDTPKPKQVPDKSVAVALKKMPVPAPASALWNEDFMKKTWDVDRLSVEDERRLGEALHGLVLMFHHRVDSGPEWERVRMAADPYLEARSRKEFEYKFAVLDSDACCAFSLPGGYVYVCRGLFDLIGKEEDYALEFVLAHEIAHVDQRHALMCLQDPDVKGLELGTLQAFLAVIIPWGYMDRLEYDADRWADTQMNKLGHTKRERLAFLRKWRGYARTNGFESARGLPKPESSLSPFENHSRAHPTVYDRLKRLGELTKPDPVRGR